MIFKGTDRDAFERASKGLTKKSRSKKYQKYKEQNEKKRKKEATSPSFFQSTCTPKIPKQAVRIKPPVMRTQNVSVKRFIEKKNILDDIRGGLCAPYLEIPIEVEKAMKEITLSPMIKDSSAIEAVKMLCKKYGLNCKINTSNIPLRF